MKISTLEKSRFQCLATIGACVLIVAGMLFFTTDGLTQSVPPSLTIASVGTNQLSITITNGISTGNYEVWWTPVLGDSVNNPWTMAAAGTGGQTNFTMNMGGNQAGFFRVLQDPAIGASTPFVSYEAESGILGGGATVVALTSPPTTEFSSPQLEASGHAYVHLAATGDSVTLTNNTGKTITTLNIRHSIPDSSGGGGISNTITLWVNGTVVAQVPVNSRQTWVYETSGNYNGQNQDPSSGNAHVFWDEAGLFVPGGIPAGGTFTLQKGSANTASYYDIDVVDLETPTPLSQPANSLSIMSYGAQSNNPSFDNTTPLLNCAAAAISAGKSVWIPAGDFYLNAQSSIKPGAVTIGGAGEWYTRFVYVSAKWTNGIVFHGISTSFNNLTIDATGPVSGPTLFAVEAGGGNWTINKVWSKHCMLVWGSGNTCTVENSRVNNSWGDGMNVNNTQSQTCTNVLIFNNFSRGNGDDAIAVNSQVAATPAVQDATVIYNTTVASWWANQMGVYGGKNIMVASNLFLDCVKKTGIELNSGFGALPPLGQVARDNKLIRCGSFGYGQFQPGIIIEGGGTNTTVANNTIINPMFEGIQVLTTWNLLFQTNLIDHPGTTGIVISSGNSGTAAFNYNTVTNLTSGQSAYINNSPSTFATTLIGNSWQSNVSGVTFFQNTQYGGTAGQPGDEIGVDRVRDGVAGPRPPARSGRRARRGAAASGARA